MLQSTTLTKNFNHIMEMEGLTQSSSNSQQNQSMTDRQSPHNLKNNIKERKDISEVGQIQPNEIDPNSLEPEGLITPEEPDDDEMDQLTYQVQRVLWPKWPTMSKEELAASPEVKYLQEAVKNGEELVIKLNRPEDIICLSNNFYTMNSKSFK
uniref:Uncharacterized protein n=1 Tax=Schizaphis graminum TaxID=13262 RepID=A0A2S2NG66_SCHGA